jgi:hypothetical protein|tara:strand:- start:3618 stop:3719 length:102 start_codon:yes stop_codon:yes gene_type:complete
VDETDTMDVARKPAVVQESVVDVETLVSTSTVS